MRARLLDTLDLFGIAHGVLALRQGADAAALPAVLRRLSQVDRVVAQLAVTGAEVRYRRVRSALVQLRTLAARGRPALAGFLSGDDAVIAVMAAAVDVVQAAGLAVDRDDEPSAHLHRALHWHRYSRGPVNDLHRSCGADICRGSLRLLRARSPHGGPVTGVDQAGDPIGAVDALVAGADPGLSSPGVETRDVVLVTGPWLAGATSLIAALRERLPEHEFVETEDIGPADAPAAVVFVVSAVAPITESDCALIDLAARHTDLVIGAVSKIDVHRGWRDVLAEDRSRLAAHASRFRGDAVGGCGGGTRSRRTESR